jgi:hypothetical protein
MYAAEEEAGGVLLGRMGPTRVTCKGGPRGAEERERERESEEDGLTAWVFRRGASGWCVTGVILYSHQSPGSGPYGLITVPSPPFSNKRE